MELKKLRHKFSVCKVEDYSMVDFNQEFCFTGRTEEENSLVCMTENVPENATERDDGWRAFRIQGILDFSLIGILARIAGLLAQNEIGIFAVSTYNTDYILTKEENYEKALEILKQAGYQIID
ncbi:MULTISPECIES: ACT domain-containing protein [Anaerostipes]|uniref:Amino acid-binding protein n=1 Tax=Anaerostipes butyraticus TaxID=645466 RepID=A0A916Q8D2_9FIRM|nr:MULTISPECIES: ACT domain-containing protein [Anaerostipes]GFO84946.1 amino acid-binding protein [Anaerostipes butyraticus]